jgi:hypothetical protein
VRLPPRPVGEYTLRLHGEFPAVGNFVAGANYHLATG